MPVPTGPISLSDIQSEFGGSSPISLSEYYRGGAYVPSGTTSAYGTIPTSGPINIGVFRGTQKSVLQDLSNHTIYVERSATGSDFYNQSSALARLTVSTSGKLIGLGSTGWNSQVTATGSISIDGNEYWNDTQGGSTETVELEDWLIGGGASNYSIRMRVVTSGSPDGVYRVVSGSYDTWLPMSEDREFYVASYSTSSQRSSAIARVCALEIALSTNTSNILKSCAITLWTSASSEQGGGGLD